VVKDGQTHFNGIPIIKFQEAQARTWDCTMVPGAGFPDAFVESLMVFQAENFGLRMQHVLNDRSRGKAFLDVNRYFLPHQVVFNNRDWKIGSFTAFTANTFHFLEGAVDVDFFDLHDEPKATGSRFTIGGLASKNPWPLLEAVERCKFPVELRLFGNSELLEGKVDSMVESGTLKLLGRLREEDLPKYYQQLDCVVHTEEFAGWANLVAEGMASGIPVICSQAGTESFARHMKTAYLLPEVNRENILVGIELMYGNPETRAAMAKNAKRVIAQFSWEAYAKKLLNLLELDKETSHYNWAPKMGLYGKWPAEGRLRGLRVIAKQAQGKTVLDLGSAEGLVSGLFAQSGAKEVHSVEFEGPRVEIAKKAFHHLGNIKFWQGSVVPWKSFAQSFSNRILKSYDLVLYLGLHQHVPYEARAEVLEGVLGLASDWFVIRTPERVFDEEELLHKIQEAGFVFAEVDQAKDIGRGSVGGLLYAFRRIK
jgi:hypothetical protein